MKSLKNELEHYKLIQQTQLDMMAAMHMALSEINREPAVQVTEGELHYISTAPSRVAVIAKKSLMQNIRVKDTAQKALDEIDRLALEIKQEVLHA